MKFFSQFVLEGRGRDVREVGAWEVSGSAVGHVRPVPRLVRAVLLGQWHVGRLGRQRERAVRDPERESVSAQHSNNCTLK